MFGFSMRTLQNVTSSPRATGSPGAVGSPKTEVGEIDTRAPFQSVKAAVSLFGESGTSPKARPIVKKSKTAEEIVLKKETQLHLALKELDKIKEELKSRETTKAQALRELEKAKRTLQELTSKLETLSESKLKAIEATEFAKNRAKQLEGEKFSRPQLNPGAWKEDVDNEREQYKASAGELIYEKQELTNLRQDFDAALGGKLTAFQEAADAQYIAKVNQERLNELSKEITTIHEAIGQVKQASLQAQQEQAKLLAEKQACLQSHRTAEAEVMKKISFLKEEFDPTIAEDFEEKLEETTETVRVLQEQLTNIRASDIDALRTATFELAEAKNALHEISDEESSLCILVDSLKMELENVKRENCNWKEKESETEALSEGLRVELAKSKAELEAALAGETEQENASNDALLTLQQLSSETENARQEIEEMKRNTEALKQEAKTAHSVEKEIEEKLQITMKDAEVAKAAEKRAYDQIHKSSERSDIACPTNSESEDKIRLSAKEFESLKKKAGELKSEADMKVATAMAQVEAITTSEKEVLKKLEATVQETEVMKAATMDALKKAEMAEAAKGVVEGELRKWHQKEQRN